MTRDEFIKRLVAIDNWRQVFTVDFIGKHADLRQAAGFLYDELFKERAEPTDNCGRCHYSCGGFQATKNSPYMTNCLRYPKVEERDKTGWCGEFKARDGK